MPETTLVIEGSLKCVFPCDAASLDAVFARCSDPEILVEGGFNNLDGDEVRNAGKGNGYSLSLWCGAAVVVWMVVARWKARATPRSLSWSYYGEDNMNCMLLTKAPLRGMRSWDVSFLGVESGRVCCSNWSIYAC